MCCERLANNIEDHVGALLAQEELSGQRPLAT
jgi:hypothetical protein